jgi:transcriptional regulator with XRE-family HTH domain
MREPTETLAAFAKAVIEARKGAGMSQDELARTSGLHRTQISLIERGQLNVNLDTIVRLARGLDTTAADLMRRAWLPNQNASAEPLTSRADGAAVTGINRVVPVDR